MKLFIRPTEYGCVIEVKKDKYFRKGVVQHNELPKSYSFAVPSIVGIEEGDEVIFEEPIEGDLKYSIQRTGKKCN